MIIDNLRRLIRNNKHKKFGDKIKIKKCEMLIMH